MSKKKVHFDFMKNRLAENETEKVKGGRNRISINTGSSGFIDWGDVEIREPNLVVTGFSNTGGVVGYSRKKS